ncbi:MAG: hypothetical protein JW814_09560 [Candidatus Krumholzibacteriota bacterium]|nr:hypothetical protein [Candidatus Krumholzibacteriota bacterium]
MTKILKPADIVDIGIEKEKKRRDFYGRVHERFSGESELAGLFAKLRDWENEHIERFEEIREGVRGGQGVESYPGEISAYMQAIVESDLYSDISPESFAEKIKTAADAIEMGIRFEKEAIIFFNGLSHFIDHSFFKTVRTLIEEEQQHLIMLFGMKKKLEE